MVVNQSETSLGQVHNLYITFRQSSESECIAQKHLPIKNDHSMMKLFGNSKNYNGVISVLKARLDKDIKKTKHPLRLLRDGLFAPQYIMTHVLTDTIRGGRSVCINLLS